MGLPAEHLAELLKLSAGERANAARALLDSLDDEVVEGDAEAAQVAELVRRMEALEAGEVKPIDGSEARSRVLAKLQSVRGQ